MASVEAAAGRPRHGGGSSSGQRGSASGGGDRRSGAAAFPEPSAALPRQRWVTLELTGHAVRGPLEAAKRQFGGAVAELLGSLATAGHTELPSASAVWQVRPDQLCARVHLPPGLRRAVQARLTPDGLLPVSGMRGGFALAAWPLEASTATYRLINTPPDLSPDAVRSALSAAGCDVLRVRRPLHPLFRTLTDASKLEVELRRTPRLAVPSSLQLPQPNGPMLSMRLDPVRRELPSLAAMQERSRRGDVPPVGNGGASTGQRASGVTAGQGGGTSPAEQRSGGTPAGQRSSPQDGSPAQAAAAAAPSPPDGAPAHAAQGGQKKNKKQLHGVRVRKRTALSPAGHLRSAAAPHREQVTPADDHARGQEQQEEQEDTAALAASVAAAALAGAVSAAQPTLVQPALAAASAPSAAEGAAEARPACTSGDDAPAQPAAASDAAPSPAAAVAPGDEPGEAHMGDAWRKRPPPSPPSGSLSPPARPPSAQRRRTDGGCSPDAAA